MFSNEYGNIFARVLMVTKPDNQVLLFFLFYLIDLTFPCSNSQVYMRTGDMRSGLCDEKSNKSQNTMTSVPSIAKMYIKRHLRRVIILIAIICVHIKIKEKCTIYFCKFKSTSYRTDSP